MPKYLPTKWADARGSQAGTTYSRNQYGLYFKDKVIPVQPNTPAQQAVKANFQSIVTQWKALTQAQRNAWIEDAVNFLKNDIFGNTFKYTGQNLFIKVNRWRAEIGIGVTLTPPAVASISLVQATSLTASISGSSVTVSFSPTVPASHTVIVYATPPLSPGINFAKSYFRKIATGGAGTASPQNLFTPYTNKFGPLTGHAGEKILMKLRTVHNNGLPGTITTVSAIITA